MHAEDGCETGMIEGCRGGERDAIEAFYRMFQSRLRHNLARVLRDAALREDVVQEALIKALRGIHSFDSSRPLWPWVRTIGLRTAFDHLHKGRRECPGLPDRGAEEEALFEACERGLLLAQALAALSERHRLVLSLRYLEDWSGAEVAQLLGLKKGALDQLIFRARTRLAAEYRRMSSDRRGHDAPGCIQQSSGLRPEEVTKEIGHHSSGFVMTALPSSY